MDTEGESPGADSIEREFKTIEILLRAENETHTTGVDCFVLAWVKMERQMRRLFTFSIYQSFRDVTSILDRMKERNQLYFLDFAIGFDLLHPRKIADLVGAEYVKLKTGVDSAESLRHKIFHGQLTGSRLDKDDLITQATAIRQWCTALAAGAKDYLGYQGFGRSFTPAKNTAFLDGMRKIKSGEEYVGLLDELDVQRKTRRKAAEKTKANLARAERAG